MGDEPDTLGSHIVPPEHVVCTVHPQITVEEFLSVIDTSCKQVEMGDTISTSRVGEHGKTSTQTTSQDRSFLLAGLHTCADLGPTMLRVFAQCQSAKALASVACCYMKMGCAVENSLTKSKSQLATGDSLQTGGLFAEGGDVNSGNVNVGKFESYPTRKLFASNEPSATDGRTESESVSDLPSDSSSVKGKPGFPMSDWVKGQEGCDLDFEPLELACHSLDAYHKRLIEDDPNLIIQGYRALLEILIQRQCPSLIQKHAGLRKIKRALGSIKKGHEIPFEDYAATALKKLNLEVDYEACCELRDSLLPQWRSLITFHCVRLLLAPVIESLVLVDRMLYLLEQGIDSRLVPIFDPLVSPRNFVLLATKR